MFIGRKVIEFAAEIRFKLLTSTPFYAHAIGQVKATKKVIISLIKNMLAKILEAGINLWAKHYGHVKTR